MPTFSVVRVAEQWTVAGVAAFIVLVIVLGIGIAAMIRRLSD